MKIAQVSRTQAKVSTGSATTIVPRSNYARSTIVSAHTRKPHGEGKAWAQHSAEASTTTVAQPCTCGCARGSYCLTTANGNFKALLCRSNATLFQLDRAAKE